MYLRDGHCWRPVMCSNDPDRCSRSSIPSRFELPRLVPKMLRVEGMVAVVVEPSRSAFPGDRRREMSGPATQIVQRRIIATTSPFHLRATGHSGWDRRERRWRRELVQTLRVLPHARHGHSRLGVPPRGVGRGAGWLSSGGPAITRGVNPQQPHRVFVGWRATFGPAIDTGVPGQSSNLLHLEGETLLTIHAQRERCGAGGAAVMSAATVLHPGRTRAVSTSAMGEHHRRHEAAIGDLKFGQPSLLRLNARNCWPIAGRSRAPVYHQGVPRGAQPSVAGSKTSRNRALPAQNLTEWSMSRQRRALSETA